MERAKHYRDLAKRYLRLAASTEYPNHYLRIAVQYNALAEADELSADGHWHFDGFGVAYDVLAPPMSEGPGVSATLDPSHRWSSLSLIHDHGEAPEPV
jgi:hypothetical protein